MKLLCIDPGTTTSGVVIFDGKTVNRAWPAIENQYVFDIIESSPVHHIAIEMVGCYGMPVGAEIFETCVWIGRFIERFPGGYDLIYRTDVKLTLCNSMRAKDANIRQAILDRFPATGGGKTPQIGTKKQPGSLYGVKKHAWSALAVGITWFEKTTLRR